MQGESLKTAHSQNRSAKLKSVFEKDDKLLMEKLNFKIRTLLLAVVFSFGLLFHAESFAVNHIQSGKSEQASKSRVGKKVHNKKSAKKSAHKKSSEKKKKSKKEPRIAVKDSSLNKKKSAKSMKLKAEKDKKIAKILSRQKRSEASVSERPAKKALKKAKSKKQKY